MKKYISIILAIFTLALTLAGCGSTTVKEERPAPKIKIVTTIFPQYDWVREVLGKHYADAELTLLSANGTDIHSYQPSVDDMAKISSCDLFIYVGGESDKWVQKALAGATNKNMQVINLLDVLGKDVKEELLVEGMQSGEHKHDHKHAEDKHDEHKHDHKHAEDKHNEHKHDHKHAENKHSSAGAEPEYDEHVWLSLKNAQLFVTEIEKRLAIIDVKNKDVYAENAKNYAAKLAALDAEYNNTVDGAPVKTLLFADRFPFRYLFDDYKLSYYAAFMGCSAETEASFETIAFLSQKMDELGLKHILKIEKSSDKIAQTVKQNTKTGNQQILTLDSMQSTTAKEIKDGSTYLSIMKNNLQVLKSALN